MDFALTLLKSYISSRDSFTMTPTSFKNKLETSPLSHESDLARIRDNQRRSRVRRKEYLQELETKLRKCELVGVQANVNIQEAGRKVSEENARLREENAILKEENGRLRAILRDMDTDVASRLVDTLPDALTAGQVSMAGYTSQPPHAEMPELLASPDQYHKDHSTESSIAYPESPSATPPHKPTTVTRGTAADNNSHHRMAQDSSTVNIRLDPSHPHSPADHQHRGPSKTFELSNDLSSCEYAAHIITSMRADVSHDDARDALGCKNGTHEWQTCKVANARLFAAVDRYTG